MIGRVRGFNPESITALRKSFIEGWRLIKLTFMASAAEDMNLLQDPEAKKNITTMTPFCFSSLQ